MPTVDTKRKTKKKIKQKEELKEIKTKSKIPNTLKPVAKRKPTGSMKFVFKGIDNKTYELTQKQKLFSELYLDPFTNGVNAVVEAGYDVYGKNGQLNYNLAKSIATENLTKPAICQYITRLLGEGGLTDQVVDKHLLYNVTQYQNLEAKNKAIDIYNKMMGRYAPERREVSILDRYRGYSDQQLKAIIEGEIDEEDL
jgi:hypothetical protein